MRIATWNINGLRARFDFLRLWLEDRRPDFVGLQELKLEDEQFPHRELEELGYSAVVFGQKAWNGVAVLHRSSTDPVSVQRGLDEQVDLGARLLLVRFGELDVCTIYCPNGKHVGHEDFPLKLRWYDQLVEHFDQHPLDAPLVLCGDFNLCPGPLDTWSEELLSGGIFHTAEERSRFQALLDSGLTDLYRHHQPDGREFSWWDYRAGAFHQNHGLRIDLVLGSQSLRERTKAVWTDRDYRKKKEGLTASDHAPVIVDLDD